MYKLNVIKQNVSKFTTIFGSRRAYQIFMIIYQSWKFHENRPNRFREILCTKSVRKRKIEKNKQHNNNKIFCWKRKTLITLDCFCLSKHESKKPNRTLYETLRLSWKCVRFKFIHSFLDGQNNLYSQCL